MTTRLALIGSMNIGGNRVKMADLWDVLSKAGHGPVETVAASGNVILKSQSPEEEISHSFATMIEQKFGIAGFVVTRTLDEVRRAVTENPFHGDGSDKMVHSIFLPVQPPQEGFDLLLSEHRQRGAERLALGDRMLFLDYVHGVGVSDITGRFIEKRLGCRGTARNMTSLKRIIAKMEEFA